MKDSISRGRFGVWFPLALILLFLAYALSRFDTLEHLGLSYSDGLESGLAWGLYYDGVMALVALLITLGLGLVHRSLGMWGGAGWVLFTWCAGLANVLHVRFFEAPLNWWVIERHLSDLFVVQDSANSFTLHPSVWASLICALLAIVPLVKLSDLFRMGPRGFGGVILLALVTLVGWRGPAWLNISDNNPLLGDQIVRAWLLQNTRSKLFQGAQSQWVDAVTKREGEGAEFGWLRAYREGGVAPSQLTPSPDLEIQLSFAPHDVLERRALLGLPESGPIHVVYLFLESVRAYELEHPEIGPLIFPRIREHIKNRGLNFKQAYSSSFEAGQTVRGQFSSFCSMLPNIGGAATYIAHTTLSIFCIQDYLKGLQYTQAWFNSHRAGYHNKKLFESRHGTTEFFEQTFFESAGVTQRIGSWGLADGPFLEVTLDTLEELSQKEQPVFANVLTINTHHPQTVIPEGRVSPELLAKLNADEEYHGLLSRYRYTDDAVGNFLDQLFSSEFGKRTLLVMVGDHSTRQVPPTALNGIQHYEARFRVPLVLMTKNSKAQQFSLPVHQIDIAPTIAGLLGADAATTWLGKDLLAGDSRGSRWVYQENGLTSYRTEGRACYPNDSFSALQCVDTSTGDPMFDVLPRVAEKPSETRFFANVIDELVYLIAYDRLMEGTQPD